MDKFLQKLLLNLDSFSVEESEKIVFDHYVKLFLDRGTPPRRIGTCCAHDNSIVRFAESRFKHAFKETTGFQKKGCFDKNRGSRIRWIKILIAGKISGCECWLYPPSNRNNINSSPKRFYLIPDEHFVVWLEPTQDENWWFSSAYQAGPGDIRRYCRQGRKIWSAQKNTP